ncbi:MAG: GNAT family N-acetyltransferase [Anaerolineae bacterium]
MGYMVLTLGYSLSYGGRDAFVDEIFIRESRRGQGISRQAFAFMEAWGRQHGLKALHLEVERANHRARAVYQALGFEAQEQYLMTCWLKEEATDFNCKRAELTELDLLLSLMHEQDSSLNQTQRRAGLSELLGNDSLGQAWLIPGKTEWCGYLIVTYSYSLEFHGRDALLDQLGLDVAHPGSTLEIKAIQFASRAARLGGAHALHVRVTRSEIHKQKVYRAAGFEDDDSYLMTKMIES